MKLLPGTERRFDDARPEARSIRDWTLKNQLGIERHGGRVPAGLWARILRRLVVMETFLRPQSWADLSPNVVEHTQALRAPGIGETKLLEQNFAIEGALPSPFSIQSGITEQDLDVYRAPYPDPASRRPLLQWPREIPSTASPLTSPTGLMPTASGSPIPLGCPSCCSPSSRGWA
jgi:hypothetical protein